MRRVLRASLAAGLVMTPLLCGLLFATEDAEAQVRRRPSPRPPSAAPAPFDAGNALRTHVGIDRALILLRSTDADERLRGLERAAAIGGAEARIVLAQAVANVDASDPITGVARRDGRALLAATRGLASELMREAARERAEGVAPSLEGDGGLSAAGGRTLALMSALLPVLDPGPTRSRTDAVRVELFEMARGVAARALALSGDVRAVEALSKFAEERSPAGEAARSALLALAEGAGVATWLTATNASPWLIYLAGRCADYRALPILRPFVLSTAKPAMRAAAIVALAELNAAGVADVARSLLKDADPAVRTAATRALVRVGARDAAAVLAILLTDDVTAEEAVELSARADDVAVANALAERVKRSSAVAPRRRALAALVHQSSDAAAAHLATFVSDITLRNDAIGALGRSRAPAATGALEALLREPAMRRLAIRGLLLRSLVHGTGRERTLAAAASIASTGRATDRALTIQTYVALGAMRLEEALTETSAIVRTGAIMGALRHDDARTCRTLAEQLSRETDPTARTLLAAAFPCGPRGVTVPSSELWARARDGGADAPLAWLMLASRASDRDAVELEGALASGDSVIRSHVARGLSLGTREDTPGRLARALTYESDATTRLALVSALATFGWDTPSGREALGTALAWDPAPDVRERAERAMSGRPPLTPKEPRDVAWLSLATATGGSGGAGLATVLRSDGLALPIAFDEDGLAVVPGLPPGAITLRLAPRVPLE